MIVQRRFRFLPRRDREEVRFLGSIFRSETVGGAIALGAAVIAVLWANLDNHSYTELRHYELGPLSIEKWAADGALTLFFFVAGLELKREFTIGSLRHFSDALVPIAAAACGVAVPALVYVGVNLASDGSDNLGGWAIPAATDIAFALAVLAVVGSALPSALRIFLLTLAVVDDLIVIVIIAVFYTESVHLFSLLIALVGFAAYLAAQQLRIRTPLIYLPLAIISWWYLHESGIHATIAGVALGLLTRVQRDEGEYASPAERLEHRLTPVSAAIAVPFFALLSAGVSFDSGFAPTDPIVLAVVLGLVIGKPLGTMGGAWLVTRFTRAHIDESLDWRDLVGVGVLAGVGFTVSLLVSDLSFSDQRREEAKAAVLAGSLIAGLIGAALLGRRNRHHSVSDGYGAEDEHARRDPDV